MSIQAVAWVLDHSQSRGLARLVLISLANAVNKDSNGECWPSMRTIAAEAGVSLGVIPSKIEELVDLGEVEVVDRGTQRKSARYRLTRLSVHDTNAQRSGDELTVQPWSEQNRKEPNTSPNGDGLFEVFYHFWTGHKYVTGVQIPKSMRGRLNAAVKEAQLAGIDKTEVYERGRKYRTEWRGLEPSPQALLANWHRFAPDPVIPECGNCGSSGLVYIDASGIGTRADDPNATTAVRCPECAA